VIGLLRCAIPAPPFHWFENVARVSSGTSVPIWSALVVVSSVGDLARRDKKEKEVDRAAAKEKMQSRQGSGWGAPYQGLSRLAKVVLVARVRVSARPLPLVLPSLQPGSRNFL